MREGRAIRRTHETLFVATCGVGAPFEQEPEVRSEIDGRRANLRGGGHAIELGGKEPIRDEAVSGCVDEERADVQALVARTRAAAKSGAPSRATSRATSVAEAVAAARPKAAANATPTVCLAMVMVTVSLFPLPGTVPSTLASPYRLLGCAPAVNRNYDPIRAR